MSEPIKPALLSAEKLAEIRDRAEFATPGPWKVVYKGNSIISQAIPGVCSSISPKTHNAEFLSNARADVPALLGHIAACEAELQEVKEANESIPGLIRDRQATAHRCKEFDAQAGDYTIRIDKLKATIEAMRPVVEAAAELNNKLGALLESPNGGVVAGLYGSHKRLEDALEKQEVSK